MGSNRFERTFHEKLRSKWYRVVLSILSSVTRSVLTLLPTMILRDVYNKLENPGDHNFILACIALFAIPLVVSILFTYDIRVSKYIFVIIRDIRKLALESVLGQRLGKILGMDKGDLFNRVIESLENLGDFYYYTLNTSVWYLTSSIVGVLLMLLINPVIASMVLVLSVCQILVSTLLQKRIRSVQEEENKLHADGMSRMRSIVRFRDYIKTARFAGTELQWIIDWGKRFWNNAARKIFNEQCAAWIGSALSLLRSLSLFLAAHFMLQNGSMNIGDFIALSNYMVWLMPIFAGLQESVDDIIAAVANKERVSWLIEDRVEKAGVVPQGELKRIELNDISYSFAPDAKELFTDLNCKIVQGERLFIVGASGSGKSTLLGVLAGLDDRYRGEIRVNGIDMRDLDPKWLHQNLIMVGQFADVLPLTLRENLNYSGAEVSDNQLMEMLRSMELENLLELPGGLDCNMKQYAHTLSDGERKRLSIARALLSQPAGLLLDEPTTGLDSVLSVKVIQNLKEKYRGLLVIVTHDKLYSNIDTVVRMV